MLPPLIKMGLSMTKPWEQDWGTPSESNDERKPWERDWGTTEDSDSPRRKSQATAADYIRAIDTGFAQGITGIGAAAGTILQDPGGAIVSGLTGARALADRGLTHLINAVDPGAAQFNTEQQRAAQIASEVAADRRAANAADPLNLPARLGQYMEQDSRRVTEEIKAKERADNPELIAQQEEVANAEGFFGKLGASVGNPLALTNTLARSAPDMAAGIGVGSALARAGVGMGGVSAAGTATEAASSGMQAREGTYQQVAGMPLETLAQSPRFNELLQAYGGNAMQAREALANELADQTPVLSALGTAAGTALTNRLFGGDATAKSIMGVEKMTAREFGKRVAQDTAEEGFQGVPEDTVQHGAVVQADVNKKWDPAGSLAENMVAGLAMGAGGHGLAYARENMGRTGPTPAPAPAATPGLAVDVTYQRPDGQAVTSTGSAGASPSVATADTTEAEKVLRTPVTLTALDRANEIDGEVAGVTQRLATLTPENGYGPTFEQERQDLATQVAELQGERAGIAATWPKSIKGAPTAFSTEAGVKLDGEYALMDAGDLITSHTESLRPNPLYPQELQPRDRSRNASEMQVSGIVQKLDPARLGLSADAGTGAPIVGADGLVESGNARTIAMKRVYQANGQKAADYKQFLRDNAAQFGLAPDAIDALEKPVLVRVRSTPVNRAEFARQANASTVQRMSPSEQALSDAKRLNSLDGMNPTEDGDFSSSNDFIRQFMATLPITEQSDLIESDGRLSTAGYRRIQNAVLARAYGDSPSLRRMTESMDNNLVNVSKALLRVAPTIAAARERMQAGTMHQADIAPDLLTAVEGLSALKEKGWTVAQELAQVDLTGPKYTPEAAELLGFLSDNIRSPRRIAEFFQRYYEALEQAGDPTQPSMFGDDGPAPARADLLKQAQGAQDGNTDQNPERGVNRESAQAAAQDGRRPQDAPGRGRGNQGDGPAGTEAAGGQPGQSQGQAAAANASEWVAFPAESGTLGIPRSDMPQVKGEHRGALINFLKARGIESSQDSVDPNTLKPTQAEFSTKKVAKFTETGAIGERSVLVSSDGYVLDGHHQWMGHQAMGDEAPVIRLDAPIQELLAAVREFPSVQRSEGATAAANDAGDRAQAVTDFKDALADLAQIASKHTRAAMVPENTPELMPTMVKLFDSAIRLIGTDMKAAKRWVKERLKADPRFKAFWNKIGDDLYQKAALQAMENPSQPTQAGLFDSTEAATSAVQGSLFDAAPAANKPKVATINGRAYDIKRDNFVSPHIDTFLSQDVVAQAHDYVEKYYKNKVDPAISKEDMTRAEALLKPLLEKAEAVKPGYDQKIIDIAKAAGALGQMIAPLKSMERAAAKLVLEESFNIDGMKDLLRSTIVVSSYAETQAVLDEITKNFELTRKPKNRTGNTPINYKGEVIRPEDPEKFGGYSDLLVNVRMPNGVIAEIQINVPEMLGAKEGPDRMAPGHKLYEAYRDAPKESPLSQEIMRAMLGYYAAVYEAASARNDSTSLKKSDSDRSYHSLTGPRGPNAGRGDSDAPSSTSANQPLSGNSTKNPPSERSPNRQPSGNLSGTLMDSPFDSIVVEGADNGYNFSITKEADNANAQSGEGSAQSQGTGAAQGSGQPGQADGVRTGSGGRDQQSGGIDDAAGPGPRQVGRPGADGVRSQDEDGGRAQPGNRPLGNAAVPAGRDIPAKSGLNYEFGPDDLTYEGSWVKKAAQNIEAVELLRRLEKEGRQATREEQKTLAKFAGWGSSELANNLFGKKLDKAASALADYDKAIKAMEAKGATELVAGGYKLIGYRRQYVAGDPAYMDAFRVLQAKTPDYKYNADHAITRSELDAARPDASTRKWLALRERLQAILTPAELAEASRSTQYAHYTSKSVVKSMWRAMERMGFKGGTILEPGAGIGVFAGLMPQAMAVNSSYTGIEFDGVTGGILKQLFPDERILVESFVDSTLPKNFYDVAIGNPPFSATKILGDPEYAKLSLSLHDYFFAKSIDRTKPGGLVVYVTSRYTMDKLDDKARKYLAERADLVGAIRLPQTAFKQNAGTDVVTDVIFLRKKVPGKTFAGAQAWGKSVPIQAGAKTFPINEYFHAHPEMVLGQHSDAGTMQNSPEPQYTVTPLAGDIEEHFSKAIERLPADIYQPARGSSAEAAQVREIDFNPKAKKEGNYYVTDAGVLMVREGGVGQRVTLKNPKDAELIKDFVPLRDALKQAHYDQLNDGDWEPSLRGLQQAYAAFVKKHGQINQFTTKMVKTKQVDEETGETFTDEEPRRSYPLLDKLKDDPDYTLVAALEKVNDDTGEITQSAFLTQRVLGKPAAAQISTPTDALLSVLNDTGEVNMASIAHRLGLTEDEAAEALGSAVYMDPEGSWTTADDYLSGNVKRKLQVAREAAKADRRLERNVTALEAAQPEPKTPSQINASMGMNWIPGEVYAQFLNETTGVSANVQWNDRTKQWIVQEMDGGKTMAATADWGTGARNATDLLEHALTGRPVRVTTSVGTGSDRKTVFDATATEAANDKLEKLKDEFQAWLWRDADRTDALVRSFNDKFNTTVPRTFDGRHLTLPGTSKTYNIFDHVKRGAWRIIQSGNTYLAHAVGSGKTFQMVIAAMEQKRLGLINKPMIVVPNHMLKQFASEWQDLYPAARLMVADENNFHTENRRRFVSRVALSDLDGVIITHSAFKLLDLDPEFKTKMIEEQLAYLRAALEEAGGKPGDKGKSRDPKIKQIEKQIENMEQKLQAAMSSAGKDANVRFDELGVDFLMVDEAHEFRKLDFTTTRQVKGISPAGSARAFDLYMKSRYLEEKTPGRSLVMASGTPVTNTLAELFTVQRFMDRQALIDRNIDDFDSWAAMFGRERTALEPNAAGKYEPVTRFSKFVNVPELTQMFREYADVLTSDNLAAMLGDKRPSVENGSRNIVITPKTSAYGAFQGELARRVKASRDWKPSKDEPNNPDPIIRIIGDGRLAAIDMRFIDPSLESDPDSKLNRMVDDVIRVFKGTADMEFKDKAGKVVEPNKGASMMVFSDLGFGAGVAANRGFNARAWFEKRLRDAGVPMGQVAFMSDYKKSSEKLKLFKDVNAGRVRLLVGSSKNMGTGVNAQQRLKALFHLDSPWYPSDLEQREGRIVRQGNKNPLVQLYAYAAKGTYDENMWKMLASKQYFIDQALSGDQTLREIEDLDSQSQYDLAAAMVAEDPRVLQLAGTKAEIEKLGRLYKAHEDQRYRFKQEYDHARATVEFNQAHMPEAEAHAGKAQNLSGDNFVAKAGSKTFDSRQDWAQALIEKYKTLSARVLVQTQTVGEVSGFKIAFMAEDVKGAGYFPRLVLETPVPITLVENAEQPLMGIAMRATNAIAELARLPSRMRERISEAQAKMDALESRLQSPFPMAGMLADKIKEAAAIEAELLAGPTKNVTETLLGDMAVNVEVDDASDIMLSRSGAQSGNANQKTSPRAWYDRLVGLLPASYRNDPHRREPLPTEDWNVQRAGEVRAKVEALNKQLRGADDRKGYGPVSIDSLGNLQADARDVSAADLSGRIKTLADDLGAGVVVTGVKRGDTPALHDAGFVSEASLAAIADRLMGRPFVAPANVYAVRAAGAIMSYKPRGFPLALFSRASAPAGGGASVEGLAALAERLRKAMPNMPRVNVLADPSQAPKKLRDHIAQQGATADVEGALHGGELYLFASGLRDMARAEHVLAAHEAAHFGLRAILAPKELKTALRMIWVNNAKVRKAATELQRRGKLTETEATEEVIVDIPSADLARLKGWRKVVQAVADFLGRRGYSQLHGRLAGWLAGTLSEQQRADLFVADLVRAARAYVQGQRPGLPRGLGSTTRLSGSLAEDLEKQEQWLSKEARARGYKDIDTLVDQDYPLFEKLATLWREKNPADMLLSRGKGQDQTQTAAFRRWFGDSKVVDAQGKPLVMYHGTSASEGGDAFTTFDTYASNYGLMGMGGYFTADPSVASSYTTKGKGTTPTVYQVFLSIKNPLDMDAKADAAAWERQFPGAREYHEGGDTNESWYRAAEEALSDEGVPKWEGAEIMQDGILAMGFDGITHIGGGRVKADVVKHRVYITFDPEQAKSATGNNGAFDPDNADIRMSRAPVKKTTAERAEAIIQQKAAGAAPLDAAARALTRITGVERLTGAIYNKAAQLLDRYTPERVKAGIVSDYGVPEAVIDQRTMLQARQRVQLRKAGELVEKLATLTRAESRVAYEWMNMDGNDPQAYVSMMQGLPEESVKVLQDVQKMIDQLSQEAVRMGQLDADAFARNRFAYLRRSYAKHTLEQTAGEKAKRSRTIAVLGEQYKGRGLSESAPMDKIKALAPDWWGRKLAKGKADTTLKGEKFLRLEYRTHKQSGVAVRVTLSGKGKPYYITRSVPLNTKTGQIPGLEVAAHETQLREVVYWPAGEKIPAQYSEWDQAGTWEVRDVKGPNAIFWRDFTKAERESMGEIDEARFAIAKTLHAMIHDVEVGRYLEWLAARQAKKEGETIPGTMVEASERMRDTFAPGEWVRVPDSKIQGTNVLKYGKLAGRYLPGPVWNDLRQVVGGQFQPFGETYAKVLSLWKTSKTALSPAVHMNNVMSNFVMADWHDVHATQVGKALRILLAASQKPGGMADREAAVEILNRYKDSGGDAGSWVTQEISREQIEPLLESLQKELAATNGQSVAAQTGIFAALQHAMQLRFPEAWDAAKAGRGGRTVTAAGGALIDLYQSEDDVFRLAAWLAAKEHGATDMEAGKLARKSFLDYNINAPWINAMRKSAWPFLSFTYRAVPMLLETAAKKPHKLMKLLAVAGALNALGVMLAGGDDDDERKMLPEEKAGGIWGMAPKLIRMPWNDAHGSPVYLDIRRWVPVGDVLDVGQGHAAVPILPGLMPGGPLVLMSEVVLNRSAFTGKSITLETDTPTQQAAKLGDYLYKAFAPNILGLPNTYATEGVVGSMTGRTDAFGREMSTAQAVASSFGVKVGSYPADVMRRNLTAATLAQSSEIDKNISQLKRQLQTGRIDQAEFQDLAKVEQEKKVKLMQKLAEKTR